MAWTGIDNIKGAPGRDGRDGRDGKDGQKGEKGDTGTFASWSGEMLPADQQLQIVVSGAPDARHVHLKIPRGLPGLNAVPADAGVAAYIAAQGTAAQAALAGLVMFYRMWDPVALTYPPRIPGAVNVFLGPIRPELGVMQDQDRWENPDVVTLAQVVAAMGDPNSPLQKATKKILPQESVPLDVYLMTSSVGSFGSAAPDLIWAPQLAKGGTNGVRFGGRAPAGWGGARLTYKWLHDASTGTVARLNTYYAASSETGITGSFTTTQNYTQTRMRQMDMPFTGTPIVAGDYVSGAIVRLSDSTDDTIAGPIGILQPRLERIA